MELKEGMYVRTDEGIAKVIEKRKNPYGEETIFIIDKPFMYHFTDFLRTAEDMIDVNFEEDTNQIKGASNNIIDLIEEGDLVRIEYFSLRYERRVTRLFEVTSKSKTYTCLDNSKCSFMLINNEFSEEDKELSPIIKSIVTKEQFSSMEYKVV